MRGAHTSPQMHTLLTPSPSLLDPDTEPGVQTLRNDVAHPLAPTPISSPTHNDAQGESLRVAVVTETWPPEVNGVALTIERVIRELRQRGHRLEVVRPRQDGDATPCLQAPDSQELLVRGLPIPGYPQLKMGLPCGATLERLWRAHRPDVVHLVTEGPLGWSALRVARRLKLPVVSEFRTNFHAYSSHYGLPWLTRPIIATLRAFHNRTACTMVPTDGLRGELAAEGFRGLQVVARGVDTQQFQPALRSAALRSQWGVQPGEMIVLSVGRLAAEKNLLGLLSAYEAMKAASSRVRLVIVGDGPERAAFQERLPDAVFAGLRRGADLAAHYASADVFLFPSLTETYGNVLPEAMASGLAVVAYDYAAAGQWVRHGVNGLLVRRADQAEFRSTAARLAGQLEYARSLGQEARTTALRMGWPQIAHQVQACYREARQQSWPERH